MNLLLTPYARKQIDALPEFAALAVAEMLFLLRRVPHIGVRVEDPLGRVFYQKLVVVVRRRWTLRIGYRINSDNLLVVYVDPSWKRRTTF